jgi:hypothetical protein
VLSNPYNIRINAPQSTGGAQGTGVDISFGITSPNAQAEPGFGIVSRPQQNPPWQDLFASGPHPRTWEVNTIKGLSSNTGTAMYSGTFGGFFPIVKNYPTSNSTWVKASNSSAPSVLDGVIFRIAAANFTFAPGESKIFFISGSGSFPGSPVFATTGYTNVATFPASGAIFTPDAAGAAEGSSKIINLAAGTAANGGYQAGYVFSQDTGVTTAVAPNSTWGHLVYFFPGQVMSMEMRTEGSAPGTNTLQRVINMDMTGSSNSEPGTNVSTSPNWTLNSPLASIPKGTSYRWDYATFNGTNAPLPQYLGGYYMMLALPDSTGLTFQVTGTGGNATIDLSDFSNYRTYADYNLRAANMAPEPFVPQNIPVVNQSSTNYDSGGFNTVPPYSRTFDLYQATTGADAYQGPTSTDDMDSNVSFPMHWGHTTATTGQTYAYLYTIPYSYSATDVGFLSIGQLQHCDLTADDYYNSVSYQPGNAVGNSFFNPYVERQVAFFAHPTTTLKSLNGGIALSASNPPGVASLPAQVKAYDISYLLNSVLWDKYFFSSLPEPNSAAAGDTSQPVNQRLKYVAGYTPTNADLGINTNNPVVAASPGSDVAMPAEYAAARYLMIDGPFNINSTSVNAWTALLWSMAASNVTVTGAGGNASIDAINGYSAFPRSMPTPSLSGNAAMWTNATIGTGLTSYTAYSGTTPESFTGFRNLNSATIANLAQQIVNQVRLRGPFVSLGQFINRTLAPYDDAGNGLTREGPLQAAIDQTIDTSIPGGKLLNSMPSAEQTVSYSPSQSAGGIKIYPDTDPNANVTGTDAGTFTEGQGARSTNIPGWLTQADLLEALGPLISARSDTFRVRAYGNVINPLDGTVQSQAWCEAIVQRYPDYVDPTDPPSANPEEGSGEPGSGVTASMVNIYFGRKYRIVSFHWLSPNQI